MSIKETRVRHAKLYLDTVVFQVDNTIFKVPSRYFHENSEAFGAASKIAAGSQDGEGFLDENPILLSPLPYDADANDFEQLANIIMALTLNFPTPANYTLHQWLSSLKLATAWEFSAVRELAMKSITEIKAENYEEWISILKFCWNRVEFTDLRELSINRVTDLQRWDGMTKIEMG
ncbi:hypothetical protein V5O48_019056, partial [Marasmius crinis-equi]